MRNKQNYLYYLIDFTFNKASRVFIFILLSTCYEKSLIVNYIAFESFCFFSRSLFSLSLVDSIYSNKFLLVSKRINNYSSTHVFLGILFFITSIFFSKILISIAFGLIMSRVHFLSFRMLKQDKLKSKLIESFPSILYLSGILIFHTCGNLDFQVITYVKFFSAFIVLILLKNTYSFRLNFPTILYDKIISGLFFLSIIVYERILLEFKDYVQPSSFDLYALYFASFLISFSILTSEILWSESKNKLLLIRSDFLLLISAISIFSFFKNYYFIIIIINSILISNIHLNRHIISKLLNVKWFYVLNIIVFSSFIFIVFNDKFNQVIYSSLLYHIILVILNFTIYYISKRKT